MAFQILLTVILFFPGIMGEYYYQHCKQHKESIYSSIARIIMISVLSYLFRCFISVSQGFGAAHIYIYFDNIDNVTNYIVISILSSLLFTNSFLFLEQTILPLWKEKQTKTEDTTHE